MSNSNRMLAKDFTSARHYQNAIITLEQSSLSIVTYFSHKMSAALICSIFLATCRTETELFMFMFVYVYLFLQSLDGT